MSVVQFVVQDLWQSHMQFWSQFALPVCHFESLSARNPGVVPSRVSLLLCLGGDGRVGEQRAGRGEG